MRLEFRADSKEMFDAYLFVSRYGLYSADLVASLRRSNTIFAAGAAVFFAAIVGGWTLHFLCEASGESELITQPASAWFRWGLVGSLIVSLLLFFYALRCVVRICRPDVAVRDHSVAMTGGGPWQYSDELCAIEVSERGVTFEDPEKSTTYAHSKVHAIDRADHFMFLYIEPDLMYPVPIRINDTTRIDELIEQIENNAGLKARFIPA